MATLLGDRSPKGIHIEGSEIRLGDELSSSLGGGIWWALEPCFHIHHRLSQYQRE